MRKATVLYRDQTGRGFRVRAGQRVPAGWLTDEQYQVKLAMERRMRAEAAENRQRLMTGVQARARLRSRAATAEPEGPS